MTRLLTSTLISIPTSVRLISSVWIRKRVDIVYLVFRVKSIDLLNEVLVKKKLMRKEIFQDVFSKKDKDKEQPTEILTSRKGTSSRSIKGTLTEYHSQNKNASLLKLLNQIKASSNIVPTNITSLTHLAPRNSAHTESYPLTVSMKLPSKTYASNKTSAFKSQESISFSDLAS